MISDRRLAELDVMDAESRELVRAYRLLVELHKDSLSEDCSTADTLIALAEAFDEKP